MGNRFYKLNESDHQKINTKLLYITEAKYEDDWSSTTHTHHFTEIFYVLHGKGTFEILGRSFPIKDHDLIIVNPSVSHTEVSAKRDPLEYIVLGITGLEFHNLDNTDYSIQNFSYYKDDLSFYLKTLLREARSKEPNYGNICQNLLEIIIWHILRQSEVQLAAASSKKVTKECRFIEQYLNEHFKEDITLQTLSELTYLNKYYLVHSFKNYKGVSPINYLIQIRINEAKHLLETTNYSIAKIATQSGFSSQSYFSQIFKRMTNMTPNDYRKAAEKRK